MTNYQVGDWLRPEDDEYRGNKYYKVGTNIEVEYLGSIYNNYGDYTLIFKDKTTGMELKIKNNELPQYIQYEPRIDGLKSALYGNINNSDMQKLVAENPPLSVPKSEKIKAVNVVPDNQNVTPKEEIIQDIPFATKHESEFSKLLKKAKLERIKHEFQLMVPKLSFIKIILDSMDFSETERDNALDAFAEFVWLKNKDEIKLSIIEKLTSKNSNESKMKIITNDSENDFQE